MQRTDTAHQVWDQTWKTPEGREDWLAPEPDVLKVIPRLREAGCREVLDLGCGVGRHAYLLATEEFQVTAMDRSDSGLAFLRQQAVEQNLELETVSADMTELPFEDQTFDYVLSWNVIYHGNKAVVQQAINEIYRVLRPGGFFQGTMLSDRNDETQTAQFVSEGTYVMPGPTEKAHPHYYCNGEALSAHFHHFDFLEKVEKEHSRPGSFHWHLLLERK